ncbi:MAG: glycine cleavage system aminomethyltransferase GcvT [Bacilli bacterium]|nr:glycine cleavage system aminomethyltransferase GcvT [Bacilli bacterium]MDD4077465.1 glycine cleavage system aminomethyltransferase GcvT [Bacilli bacterium]MDD4388438.1 glycine cleavage system aminomethyltransferase GcvT [Bacilli bacterium]
MKKTILFEEHLHHNAKMVEFAGYLMPIEYRGIAYEHQAVRERCGLFDVSHMGQIKIAGKDTVQFVNYILTNDIAPYDNKKMIYGLMLNDGGGVVDDLMVYKFTDEYCLLVVNAANKDKDYQWIVDHRDNFDVEIEDLSPYYSQLALQGPLSIKILQEFTDYQLDDLKTFDFDVLAVMGCEFIVSRSGYTGEDGFEIYGSNHDILRLFKKFKNISDIALCGLGCRDTLRFEAAMPLYGHEIGPDINPLEAGLAFAVKMDKNFIGRNALLASLEQGLKRKIVAIELLERGIARTDYSIEADNRIIGKITTGYLIPNTDKAYAFGLVESAYSTIGTQVLIHIRKNKVNARVRNKKFLTKKYIR